MIDFFTIESLRIEEYLKAGGITMIPLTLVSLLMWCLIINRALFFRRLYRKNMSLGTAAKHIRSDLIPDPLKYRGVISLLVTRFIQRRSHNSKLDRYIFDEIVVTINHCLNDHLSMIGVLAAIAPLLGLLGTVIGMISTFDILAVFGTGNAKGMANGISEALITTQTGLLVAIPGFYMKGFLDRRAQSLKRRIAQAGYYLKRHI